MAGQLPGWGEQAITRPLPSLQNVVLQRAQGSSPQGAARLLFLTFYLTDLQGSTEDLLQRSREQLPLPFSPLGAAPLPFPCLRALPAFLGAWAPVWRAGGSSLHLRHLLQGGTAQLKAEERLHVAPNDMLLIASCARRTLPRGGWGRGVGSRHSQRSGGSEGQG